MKSSSDKKESNEKNDDDDSNGSDSEPSCDNLDNEVLNNLLPINVIEKKRTNKTRTPLVIRMVKIKKLEDLKDPIPIIKDPIPMVREPSKKTFTTTKPLGKFPNY